jgi:hypothetical protein
VPLLRPRTEARDLEVAALTVFEYLIALSSILVGPDLTDRAQRFTDLIRTGAVRPNSNVVTRPDGSR